MAFTTRASKDTGSALLQHGDTPPEVGPGSYGLEHSRHAHTAPAPFHSTADRSPVVRPDAASLPGPGSYATSMQGRQAAAMQKLLQREQAPAFASAVDRFAADKATPAFTPGPGAYKPRQPWTKGPIRRHSAPSDRTRPNHLHMAASRQLLAGPSAPTIPAPHQSYGYERAHNGSWVLQPPPASEAAEDAACPSSSAGAAASSRGGTAWGASKTARLVSKSNPVPGPGTYTADEGSQHTRWHVDARGRLSFAGGRPGIVPAAKGTSSFTTVSRGLEGPAEPEVHPPLHTPTPGPGAYQLPPSFRPSTDPNRSSQPFFMASRRSDTFGVGSSSGSSMPGPGAYTAPSAFAGSGNGHGGMGGTPFLSVAQRFGGVDNTTPGPGNYATQDLLGISQEVGKKLAGKHGTFGPSSSRLTAGRAAAAGMAEAVAEEAAGLAVVEATPGPGGYDVVVEAVHVRDAGRASAAFASGTQRFKVRTGPSAAKAPATMEADTSDRLGAPSSSSVSCGGDAGAALGPGHYKLPDEWTAQKAAARSHRKAPFGSQTDRFALPGTRSQPPSSPGTADVAASLAAPSRVTNASRRPSSAHLARKAGFASGGTRFQSHETASPGPGAYTVDVPVGNSGFVKRSYNVTVDGW